LVKRGREKSGDYHLGRNHRVSPYSTGGGAVNTFYLRVQSAQSDERKDYSKKEGKGDTVILLELRRDLRERRQPFSRGASNSFFKDS